MPLPPLVKQLVEKKLSAYCQRKIPAHLHNEIRLNFKFRGNTVTLFESRPAFGVPVQLWGQVFTLDFLSIASMLP